MKKSEKKPQLTLEDLIKDTYELSKYVKDLNNIDLKDLNIDEIQNKTEFFNKKYKKFFKENPKKDVDSEK
tara:strand:- start:284 stop:493 length:210 start_codon:yes stop_codon:yes gene_type:complete